MSIEGGNRQEACTEISMEAITDKTRHCAFFVPRLIFAICPTCNPNPLITSTDEHLHTSNVGSTPEHIFWCRGFLQVLTQISLFSSRSWSAYYPVFRAQSAPGLSDGVSSIRNRRITFALHLYYATSLLCYITLTFALHLYYASSRHMASICKRQTAPHCKLLSPHLLSSSEISDYLWNIRTR